MVTGQIDLFSSTPSNLSEMVKQAPAKNLELKFAQKDFDLGIALNKEQPKLKEWVNNWVVTNQKNGKLNAIYKKYHGRDLPEPTMEASNKKLNRLLLTGAAGGLGKVLRGRLKPYAKVLRLSDIASLAPAADASEEVVPCDLSDKAAVHALLEGCDAIVHLGGVSVERPFEEILEANIKGIFNVYEAARRHGVKRVVFASSNHVIGFYKQSEHIDAHAARRPDGYYGLSKSFGEDMAQFYFDRWGIETVSIRIGSSFPEPLNRRMMSTWLSYRDLTTLIEKSPFTPDA
eukprot:gene52246-69887_t